MNNVFSFERLDGYDIEVLNERAVRGIFVSPPCAPTFKSRQELRMNKSLIKLAIVIALASGASGALAQSAPSDSAARAKAFAHEFKVLQSYSATGPTWQLHKLKSGFVAQDPSPGLAYSAMQAVSSESPTFHAQSSAPSTLAAAPADGVPRHGLSDAQMQALSSESPTYQPPNQASAG